MVNRRNQKLVEEAVMPFVRIDLFEGHARAKLLLGWGCLSTTLEHLNLLSIINLNVAALEGTYYTRNAHQIKQLKQVAAFQSPSSIHYLKKPYNFCNLKRCLDACLRKKCKEISNDCIIWYHGTIYSTRWRSLWYCPLSRNEWILPLRRFLRKRLGGVASHTLNF